MIKQQTKKMESQMTTCSNFCSITHQCYEDAGCFGCAFLQMWTDGYYDCTNPKQHEIVMRKVDSKVFGVRYLVVRYNGRE